MTARSFFKKLQAVTPAKPKSKVYRKNGVLYHAGFGLPLYYVKKNEKKAKSAVAAAKAKTKKPRKKSPLVGKVAVLKQELKQAKAQLQLVLTAAETAAKKVQQPPKRHVVDTVPEADPRIAGDRFIQDSFALYSKPSPKPKPARQMRRTPRLVDPPKK